MELLFEKSKTNHRYAVRNTVTCVSRMLLYSIIFSVVLIVVDLPCMLFPSQATVVAIVITNIIFGVLWIVFMTRCLLDIIRCNDRVNYFDEKYSLNLENVENLDNTPKEKK